MMGGDSFRSLDEATAEGRGSRRPLYRQQGSTAVSWRDVPNGGAGAQRGGFPHSESVEGSGGPPIALRPSPRARRGAQAASPSSSSVPLLLSGRALHAWTQSSKS